MDGNGRWAQARGLPRVEGHRAGAKTVNAVVRHCRELGVQALTLYAFSAQNWARPEDEVGALMTLLADYVRDERLEILHNNIRLTTIGAVDALPSFVRRPLDALCAESAGNQGMTLALALSYGGREEILQGVRRIASRVAEGGLQPAAIDASIFESSLYTHDLPPLDLLIRTSGEQRLSNFLLWQCAYAELYFSPVAWPDFGCDHLDVALQTYARRERRFGLTSAQIAEETTTC